MTRSKKQKQQRLKTKSRKMKGGTEEVVYSFFDKELIKKEGKDEYIVICELNEDDESHFCIFEDKITIYTISKCGERSGTSILEKIIQIAKQLNKSTVNLADASTITISKGCKYDLSFYKILLTGQSWYNKFGFISENHATDVDYNEHQRRLSLNEFAMTVNNLQKMKDPMSRPIRIQYEKIMKTHSTLENYKEQMLREIESKQVLDKKQFCEVFSDLGINENMPVNKIIEIIDAYIKAQPSIQCDEKMKMLIDLIKSCNYILKYTHLLVLTLPKIESPLSTQPNQQTSYPVNDTIESPLPTQTNQQTSYPVNDTIESPLPTQPNPQTTYPVNDDKIDSPLPTQNPPTLYQENPAKTLRENIFNCKYYWRQRNCETQAKTMNYPGIKNKLRGQQPAPRNFSGGKTRKCK
jgi:predicted metal-binding protein